jgi:hypothetical protein
MRGKKRVKSILLVFSIILSMFFVINFVSAEWCLETFNGNYCNDVDAASCCGSATCDVLKFKSDPMPSECISTNKGCCYANSGNLPICADGEIAGVYQAECDDELGNFSTTCANMPENLCGTGCCCWKDNNDINYSTYNNFKGDCDNTVGSTFYLNSIITNADACHVQCGTSTGTGDPTEETQCNDGIDNDGDGDIDSEDQGCEDSEGNYDFTDNSEPDSNLECGDQIDNDNDLLRPDGGVDSDDKSCQLFPNKEEKFFDLEICDFNTYNNLEECRCQDNYKCTEGQYCCTYGCFNQPCSGSECVTGSRRSCGEIDSNDCETFQYCKNGDWDGICQPDPSCGIEFELCDDGIDNNNDGLFDCNDVICHTAECSKTSPNSCGSKGYRDLLSETERWLCCYSGQVNDCDGDINGEVDTCGDCNCLQMEYPPYLTKVSIGLGENKITVEWGLNCESVLTSLYKCDSTNDDCDDFNNYVPITSLSGEIVFYDNDFIENNDYCYVVQANYNGNFVESDKKCVKSGSEICQKMTTDEFCLNETKGTTGDLILKAGCSEDNTLWTKSCREAGNSNTDNLVCMGPYSNAGEVECVYQSICDECGTPLNMYSDFDTSMAYYSESNTNINLLPKLCKSIPTCFYDTSETTIDKFDECSDLDVCYRYRSKIACEEQPNKVANNKCLPRDCAWDELNNICFETIPEFKRCEYCNYAENNNVFDKCTPKRCMLFGECFPRAGGEGLCTDATDITCYDYLSKTHCMNATGQNRNVSVNVEYSEITGLRLPGNTFDNSITPSDDSLGLGLCKWKEFTNSNFPSYCYKDADGNGIDDIFLDEVDNTPPYSKLLMANKVLSLNFTLEIVDVNPDGSVGTGPMRTFLCKNNTAQCYPTEIVKYPNENGIINYHFGAGHGLHHIYYYSEDLSNNLEVLQHAIIEVDKQPPQISIQASVRNDYNNYVDSNVTFVVTINENATCHDDFEDATRQITHQLGSNWVVSYKGLDDGIYLYKVNCTDSVGNTAIEYYNLRIDADSEIFNPRPIEKIDYQPVVLSIDTLQNINDCTYGANEDSFQSPIEITDVIGTYYMHKSSPYFLDGSGLYSIDVKCNLGDRVSRDEIQFVYDKTSPVTTLVDELGNLFDDSSWYNENSLKEKLYLTCTDGPEYGFGCNKTLYCIDSQRCDPDVNNPNHLSNPLFPIDYEIIPGESSWLCFYSVENIINSFGGITEDKNCQEIKIDYIDPLLTINGDFAGNSQTNPYVTFDDTFTVTGSVVDEDALSNPQNIVDIYVEVINGTKKEYLGVPANINFLQNLPLEMGLNVITILAYDRSTTNERVCYKPSCQKILYVKLVPYSGMQIQLAEPTNGVARTRIADFKVWTYKDAECKYSITGISFTNSEGMTRTTEPTQTGYEYYHTKTEVNLAPGENEERPFYVKCKDRNGAIFEEVFWLSWDNSKPVINEISLDNSDGKNPPTVVEFPLETNIIIPTKEDPVRCRYALDNGGAVPFESMIKFNNFDNKIFNKTNKQFFGPDLEDPSTTNLIFQCENGAGLISDKVKFALRVDTSAATGIKFLSPAKKTPNASNEIKISTTKTTQNCKYGINEYPNGDMQPIDDNTHTSGLFTKTEGKYKYYVTCEVWNDVIKDYYEFTIDTTAPSTPKVDDGEHTYSLGSLSAKVSSTDNLTKIAGYSYQIGKSKGANPITGWIEVDNSKTINAKNVTLINGSTYYWSVKAKNEVGLWSAVGYSDGVIVDTSKASSFTNSTGIPVLNPQPIHLCYNGVQDKNETDVDCGGSCSGCEDGGKCLVGTDCTSKNCVDNICIKASCDDLIKNQDESDVDCGGSVCNKCPLEKYCNYDTDCESLYCNSAGVCSTPTCSDGVKNGKEEGKDCGGDCPNICTGTGSGCTTSDGEIDSDCDRMPDSWEEQYEPILNKNKDDGDEDPDEDGFSNYDEYVNNTDPTSPDGKSGWGIFTWVIIILSLLIIIVGGTYVGYIEYMKKNGNLPLTISGYSKILKSKNKGGVSVAGNKGKFGQRPLPKAKTPEQMYIESLGSMIRSKRKIEKSKNRKDFLSTFDEGKSEEVKEDKLVPLKIRGSKNKKSQEPIIIKPVLKKIKPPVKPIVSKPKVNKQQQRKVLSKKIVPPKKLFNPKKPIFSEKVVGDLKTIVKTSKQDKVLNDLNDIANKKEKVQQISKKQPVKKNNVVKKKIIKKQPVKKKVVKKIPVKKKISKKK